jgi:hypothetical protein
MAKKAAKKAAKRATKAATKKTARKASKKSVKKGPKKTASSRPVGSAAAAAAGASDDSPVARFFNEVDINPGLQGLISAHNSRIIEIAKAFDPKFDFTYEEMSNHLRVRWCIECGPKDHYCCF